MGYLDDAGLTRLWGKIKALVSPVEARVEALETRTLFHGQIRSSTFSQTFTLESGRHYLLAMNAYGSSGPSANTQIVYLIQVGMTPPAGAEGVVAITPIYTGSSAATYVTNRVSVTSGETNQLIIAATGTATPYVLATLTEL